MRWTLCALLITVAFPLQAGERISMTVWPLQSMAPTNLSIRLRVEPNPDARYLQVVADSGAFLRSSQIQLNGDRAQRTTLIEFRNVPGGEYEVLGVLLDGAGREIGRVHQTAVVVASATDY
jgi:hypothetical protein